MYVSKSDLGRVNITGYFNRVGQTTRNIVHTINNFVSSTTELTGNGYDQIRQKMSFYADALNKTAKICFLFANNVTAANHKMITYMEDLDEIDTSLIGETEASLRAAHAELDRLESYYPVTYTDKEGNSCTTWERAGSDAEIAYCKEVIAYLEHILKLMKGLKAEDDADFGMLDAISEDINNLSRAISGIDLFDFSSISSSANMLDDFVTPYMSESQIALLEEAIASWPADLGEDRKLIIQIAMTYLGRGHIYDQIRRGHYQNEFYGHYNAPPDAMYLDCSSFVSRVIREYQEQMGIDYTIKENLYTGGYVGTGDSRPFDKISNNELLPGDIVLLNTSTDKSQGENHVAIYVGKDSSGKNIYIECTQKDKTNGMRITTSDNTVKFTEFRRIRTIND